MKKRLKIFLIILAVIVVLVAVGAVMISKLEKNLAGLADIPVEDVDLSSVPDGTYKGSYEALPVSVEVEVTVKDNSITAINLVKHFNGQGQAAEVIPGMVVEAQSLQVDVISGATYSSKVILLAIEDALKSAE